MRQTEIEEWILAGDCACAFGDLAALERVCTAVASLDGDMDEQVHAVRRWAARDLVVATHFWEQLAATLRRRLSARAPLPGSGPAQPG
jgi:hypothetical protein